MEKSKNTYLKINQINTCNSCFKIFANKTNNKYLKYFRDPNSWNSFFPENKFEIEKLDDLDMLFQPKYIYTAKPNTIKQNIDNLTIPDLEFHIHQKKLDNNKIEEVSNFTKDLFYGKHKDHYHLYDMKKYYEQQKLFFNMNTYCILHYNENTLSSVLVLAEYEIHPHYKDKAWHIGFWGIHDRISNKSERLKIKNIWAKHLATLNKTHRIVVSVDFFNKSAIQLAENFNFTFAGTRLDARS